MCIRDRHYDLAAPDRQAEAVDRRLRMAGELLGQLDDLDHRLDGWTVGGDAGLWGGGGHRIPREVVSRWIRTNTASNSRASTITASVPPYTRLGALALGTERMPRKISWPSPGPPTSAAMAAMPTTTWVETRIPVMITGQARGISTRIRRRWEPI